MSDRMMRREFDHRAFTLIELLVVIAIIVLLIAFIVPNLTGVLRWARTHQCARNLRHIGEAVMNCRTVVGDDHLLASAWPESIARYVNWEKAIYICPEDVEPSGGGMTENFPFQMAVSPPGTWGGISHYLDLTPGPLVRKISVEQHAAYWLTASGGGAPPPIPYDGPEGIPVTYFLMFEDASDGDTNDCQVKVDIDAGGVATFYPADTPWSGYKFFFVWKANHTNALDSDEPLAIYPAEPRSATVFGAPTSYGMNDDVPKLGSGTTKILAADYEQVIANSQDQWTDWHENGVPTFARHGGKMNVLHMNGSVKLRSPDEIDPVEASVAKRCWQR